MRTSRVSLSQSVRHFVFDQGTVLWHEQGSRVFVYNDTMRLLLSSLANGTTCRKLAAILADTYGIERHHAFADCAALLDHLQNEGLLAGSGSPTTEKGTAGAREVSDADGVMSGFTTHINGRRIRVGASSAITAFLRPLFPDPKSCEGAADTEILCRPSGRGGVVTVDGHPRARPDDPTELVGAILEQIVRAISPALEWLAFLHAGSVQRNGVAIVLPGASGSGKSTLVGFLASIGFDYLSDDLVPLVTARGDVAACPLAINLKTGSRGLFPAPANFKPVTFSDRFRTDQLLLPPYRLWETPPTPTGAVVFPRYNPDSSTSFARIAPLEGLARLFNDRVFLGYPLEEGTIANFLRWAERTPFYSLEYSQLAEAARCLATLTG